jgi:hypothetical protein
MGTRAQIDVRQGKKVIRTYTQFDGFPRNILPALRAAASARHSTPSRIARAVIKQWGLSGGEMQIIDEDYGDGLDYRYVVDASSKPWRVRQTRSACCDLPTKPDGSLDDSKEAFENAKIVPAVTRSFRIGK